MPHQTSMWSILNIILGSLMSGAWIDEKQLAGQLFFAYHFPGESTGLR